MAIRWPSGNFERHDDITVLQDIFPAVFSYLFSDASILEAKIDPTTIDPYFNVRGGIILEGIDKGEPLFLSGE